MIIHIFNSPYEVEVQIFHFYGCCRYTIAVDNICPSTNLPLEQATHLIISPVRVTNAAVISAYGVCEALCIINDIGIPLSISARLISAYISFTLRNLIATVLYLAAKLLFSHPSINYAICTIAFTIILDPISNDSRYTLNTVLVNKPSLIPISPFVFISNT